MPIPPADIFASSKLQNKTLVHALQWVGRLIATIQLLTGTRESISFEA